MKNITEIKEVLSAYNLRDLQTFKHILQYFEGVGSDMGTVRRVLQEVVHNDAIMHRRILKKHPEPKENVLTPCPQCGETVDEKSNIRYPAYAIIKIDDTLIGTCRVCRWSAIVEG